MKISKRLRQDILKEFSENIFETLCFIDEKDRAGEITHSAWQQIHSQICAQREKLQSSVLSVIDSYGGKR